MFRLSVTTKLELRRAFAVFECCASDLEATWNELDGILLTYSNTGMLAKADKERARHLMGVIETQLEAVKGKVEGMVDAVVALNVARLKYPSKNWIIDGVTKIARTFRSTWPNCWASPTNSMTSAI
ncbi:hypothetical protein [Burkholderia metallica]|uniref:hypothetical protein n=1 Tax=Burkholderia metallica TaxID=488729 RepID=UPI00131E9330|nr:hypothetical protein [Burkholderia metallica]